MVLPETQTGCIAGVVVLGCCSGNFSKLHPLLEAQETCSQADFGYLMAVIYLYFPCILGQLSGIPKPVQCVVLCLCCAGGGSHSPR